jgi:hypothetical protein
VSEIENSRSQKIKINSGDQQKHAPRHIYPADAPSRKFPLTEHGRPQLSTNELNVGQNEPSELNLGLHSADLLKRGRARLANWLKTDARPLNSLMQLSRSAQKLIQTVRRPLKALNPIYFKFKSIMMVNRNLFVIFHYSFLARVKQRHHFE